jgi:murein biosynthesis integral membrane protein MurJ
MSMGANIIILPFILYYLNGDMLGLWYIFVSIGAIAVIFDFGFSATFARNIAYCWSGAKVLKKEHVEFVENSEPDFFLMKNILYTCRKIYLVLSLAVFVLIGTIGTAYIMHVARGVAGSFYLSAWLIYAAAVFLNLYYGYYAAFLRGVGAVEEANKNIVLARGAHILVTVIFLVCGFGLVGACIGYLVYGTVFRLLGKRKFYKHHNIGKRLEEVREQTDKDQRHELFSVVWHNGWRTGLVDVANYCCDQFVILICSLYMSLIDTGIYSLSVQLVTMIAMVATACYTAFQPMLQSAYITNNIEKTRRSMSLVVCSFIGLFLLGMAALVFVGLPILRWVKPEAIVSMPILLGLGLYQLVLKFRNCYTSYFSCSNRLLYYKSFLVSAGICVLLAFVFLGVLHLGMWGLVLAQIISQVVYNVWAWPLKAHREMGISLFDMISISLGEVKKRMKPKPKTQEIRKGEVTRCQSAQTDPKPTMLTDNTHLKKGAQSAVVVVVTMMALTLGSRCFGFVREMFLASYFGTSYVVDAYVMAINIPQLVFQGVIVAVAATFIPICSKLTQEHGREGADLFTSRTINTMTIVSIAVSAVGICFSKQFVYIFAHGWLSNPDMLPAIELTTFFLKVTFAAILFSALAEILDSYQRCRNHYYTPIFANYFYSISIIAFVLVAHRLGNRWIVFGVLAGFFLRFLVDGVAVKIGKYRHRLDTRPNDTTRRVFLLAAPVFFAHYLNVVTVFVDKWMASWLPEGSIAALNYGNLVNNLFVTIVGAMIATYLYPKMSCAFADKDKEKLRRHFNKGLGILLVVGVPVSIGCLAYSRQLIQLIYERNAFDAASTDMTTTTFFYYAIGLAFQIPILFLVQSFYSAHDTKTPVVISVVCAAVNVAGNLALIKPMGIGGVALSTSIAFAFNLILLLLAFRKKYPGLIAGRFPLKLAKILLASVAAVGVSYIEFRMIGSVARFFVSPASSVILLFVATALAIGIAAILYLALLKLFGVEEVRHRRRIIRR